MTSFFSSPHEWVWRRMTAGPLVVNRTPGGPLTSPKTLGITYAETQVPDQWRFALPPSPERSPLHPDFTRFDERSLVANSDSEVEQWLDAAYAQYQRLQNVKLDEQSVMITELPHWKKLTVQRGQVPWWFVHAPGPGRSGRSLPPAFVTALRQLIRRYAAAYEPIVGKPDPADTNSGFPTFKSHPVGKVVSNMLGGNDLHPYKFLDVGRAFCQMISVAPETAWGFGLGGRSGPSYKTRPVLLHNGGATYTQWGTAAGFAQRNRIVYMAAASCNRLLRPLYERLQGARRRMPGLWHAGGVTSRPLAPFPHQYEADISGFDASVTPELQDALMYALIQQWPDLDEHIRLWRTIEELPFLTPAWSLTQGLGGVVQALGGTRSGIKTTAEAGTLYARAATEYALSRQGFGLDDVVSLSLGDDVRIAAHRPLDPDAWAESFMEVGLTCELIPGDGFLARHLTRSLDGIPIAGRIVQQTMSNEHERFGPEALGIHYLGFIARTEGSEALPSVLQDAAWQVIKHARWVRDLAASHRSVTDLKSLRQLLSTDSTVKEVIAEALRSTAGLEWLSEHTRAAEHSEVGRRLLSWITEDVRRLQLPQVSLEHYIDAASHRLAALPETQRLRMALDGYYAVAASSVQAHRWLNSVLNEACKPTLLSYP